MATRRRCAFCDQLLPKDARSNRKYCGEECRRGKPKLVDQDDVELGPVASATETALAAATHLRDVDAGAIQTLRFLAKKIDTEEEMRDLAIRYAGENNQKPPPVDNVSIPTYLKYCESLGLTPAARAKFAEQSKEGEGVKPRGKLSQLRSIPKPAHGA